MAYLTCSEIESTALDWLKALGWQIRHGAWTGRFVNPKGDHLSLNALPASMGQGGVSISPGNVPKPNAGPGVVLGRWVAPTGFTIPLQLHSLLLEI